MLVALSLGGVRKRSENKGEAFMACSTGHLYSNFKLKRSDPLRWTTMGERKPRWATLQGGGRCEPLWTLTTGVATWVGRDDKADAFRPCCEREAVPRGGCGVSEFYRNYILSVEICWIFFFVHPIEIVNIHYKNLFPFSFTLSFMDITIHYIISTIFLFLFYFANYILKIVSSSISHTSLSNSFLFYFLPFSISNSFDEKYTNEFFNHFNPRQNEMNKFVQQKS